MVINSMIKIVIIYCKIERNYDRLLCSVSFLSMYFPSCLYMYIYNYILIMVIIVRVPSLDREKIKVKVLFHKFEKY